MRLRRVVHNNTAAGEGGAAELTAAPAAPLAPSQDTRPCAGRPSSVSMTDDSLGDADRGSNQPMNPWIDLLEFAERGQLALDVALLSAPIGPM